MIRIDITKVTAEPVSDVDNFPTLVVRQGDIEIVLTGTEGDYAAAAAGVRRIVSAIWDYQLALATRELNHTA